jgi:hypothetical protein
VAISFVQAVSASAASVSGLSGIQAGDLMVVFAYANTTSVPTMSGTGFTVIVGGAGTQQACNSGYKIAAGGETTAGTFTNATAVVVMVYRGCNTSAPIGVASAIAAASSTILTYQSTPNFQDPTNSWVLGFGGARSATTGMNTEPTGGTPTLTLRTSQLTISGCDAPCAGATFYNSETVTISPTSRSQALTMEIKAIVAVQVLPELIKQPMTPGRSR